MPGFFKNKLAGLFGKRDAPPGEGYKIELIEGGLYSTFSREDGVDYGVVKVLKLELPVVHLRLYMNRFPARPTRVDPAELSLGNAMEEFEKASKLEAEGVSYTPVFGIGHIPIEVINFIMGFEPVLIQVEPVVEEELEGYDQWKEAGGGVFGMTPEERRELP